MPTGPVLAGPVLTGTGQHEMNFAKLVERKIHLVLTIPPDRLFFIQVEFITECLVKCTELTSKNHSETEIAQLEFE